MDNTFIFEHNKGNTADLYAPADFYVVEPVEKVSLDA